MSRQDGFLILLTSIGLIFAFPPFPTGFIATVTLVPFFFYLRGKKAGEAFKGGYIVGLLWGGGTIYWIGWATGWGLLGVLLILPLYFAFFASVQTWLWKRLGNASLWTVPFVWTGIELLSSMGILSFPWNLLGYTQTYTPVMIQYASITGVYGVSFWIVLINVLVYFLCTRKKKRFKYFYLSVIFVLILLPWSYGHWTFSNEKENTEEIKLALVQGNIDPYVKWTPSFIDSNFAVYNRLTWNVSEYHPDLIVWPETATPCYLRYRLPYLDYVKSQVDSLGIPLLTGSPDFERSEDNGGIKTYNGALLVYPNSWEIDRYYKMHLVPFSERVPFVDKLTFLYDFGRKLDLDIGNFDPGDSVVVFNIPFSSMAKKVCFSVVICYESIYPYLVRRFVQKGAQFLLVITNDGWFGATSGPYQHAQIAVFRAIENRLWVARCANTGISEFIDPYGIIHAKTKLNEESILTYSVFSSAEKTFFLEHGQLFSILLFIANGLILLVAIFKKRTD